MLDFIKEKKSVWERLEKNSKPIVLYGMGNGADKIIDWCENHQVPVAGVFASDEFVRGQVFRGFTVRKYSDIIAEFGTDIFIVIAFASEGEQVLQRFQELDALHETVAPHLSLFGGEELVSAAWLKQHETELQQVYDRLADEQSRRVFAATLNYKLSGKIKYLFDCTTARADDLQLFSWGRNEVYMDLGAYNGDTVQEFLQLVQGEYQQIIAVEPDRKNYRKLRALAEGLEQGKLTVHQVGIWEQPGELGFSDSGGRQSSFCLKPKNVVPVDTIDHLAGDWPVSYIKMDVEGAEVQALRGGCATLQRHQPKLFVAAYHYDADLYRLPLLIWQLVPEYKLYLRKHSYVPAWELNFLAVKQRD